MDQLSKFRRLSSLSAAFAAEFFHPCAQRHSLGSLKSTTAEELRAGRVVATRRRVKHTAARWLRAGVKPKRVVLCCFMQRQRCDKF